MHFDYELLPSVDEETVETSNGKPSDGIFADLVSGVNENKLDFALNSMFIF